MFALYLECLVFWRKHMHEHFILFAYTFFFVSVLPLKNRMAKVGIAEIGLSLLPHFCSWWNPFA
jgi:hypothetical protein